MPGKADAFLATHRHENLFISFIIAGELACGQSAAIRKDWENLWLLYPVLPLSKEVAWQYGEIYRDLAAKGKLTGGNNMWIAATALAHGHAVVTNNVDGFGRGARLRVEAYQLFASHCRALIRVGFHR